MNNEFQHFRQEEAELFSFYQIPKELTTNSKYKNISNDAKFLYGILRDRNQLSVKNNWTDDEGRIYIIFTREEAMEILNVAKEKMSKIFKELLDVNLIRDVRQGLNKPNIIYVGKIIHETVDKSLKSENRTLGSRKIELQNVGKSNVNNTNINNTDISKSHTGSKNIETAKALCGELSKNVEKVLGEKIGTKKLRELIHSKGVEAVEHYLTKWDKYRQHAHSTQASYFIYAVENELPAPQPSKATTAGRAPNYANFDQRDYSEEELEPYYITASNKYKPEKGGTTNSATQQQQ